MKIKLLIYFLFFFVVASIQTKINALAQMDRIRWPLNGVVERDKTAFEFIDALFKESFAKISTVVEILAKDSLNSAYMKVSFGRKATN